MTEKKIIRVLIVDDSSVIRTMFSKILSSDPEIEVVAVAPDPYIAREKLVKLKPDVMTLDIEMPKMDGITFLEKVMKYFPIRTLVCSSLSTKGSETALRALQAGAIDVMAKPAIDVSNSLESLAQALIARVKLVAQAKLVAPSEPPPQAVSRIAIQPTSLARTTHQVIAIASSTGGTEALKQVVPFLPPDLPGTVIVQHMPAGFTRTYAESLQRLCPFEVKEAEDGDKVMPGRALLAPGNFHMELVRSGGYYHVRLHQEPLIHGVRPAADFLFRSVAKHVGSNAIGIVLTGMGKDGAQGLLEMKAAGSHNIAQNEDTCVVYGMPKAAVDLNAIHKTLPLNDIASAIKAWIKTRDVA